MGILLQAIDLLRQAGRTTRTADAQAPDYQGMAGNYWRGGFMLALHPWFARRSALRHIC
jgi:hypothetical protein